jgi:hypothetical protein
VGGLVVVVVGGVVGGVVVGGLVVGADVPAVPDAPRVVVVGGLVVVVLGAVPDVPRGAGRGTGGFEPAAAPGCSRATVTPMKAVAPPATRMVALVRWRMRASARARATCGWSRLGTRAG